MSWQNIFVIAIGLAMDALAVSISAGITIERITHRHVFRLAFHFGLFQFLMPILGWLAGQAVVGYIQAYDHWVAFALLAGIGGKMLWELRRPENRARRGDPTRGWMLVTLSLATSMDALAVGLALMGVSIWLPSVIIGLVAGALTTVGIRFGSRIGERFGHWAEAAGGLVLIGIGARILLQGLLAGP